MVIDARKCQNNMKNQEYLKTSCLKVNINDVVDFEEIKEVCGGHEPHAGNIISCI
jgi:hypothetical protein